MKMTNMCFRLTASEKILLETTADSSGKTVSAYVRSLVQRAIKRTLARMERKE